MSTEQPDKPTLTSLRVKMVEMFGALDYGEGEDTKAVTFEQRRVWHYRALELAEQFGILSKQDEYVDNIPLFWSYAAAVWRRLYKAAHFHAWNLDRENSELKRHVAQLEARLRVLGKDPARIDVTKVPIGTTFGKWMVKEIEPYGYNDGTMLIEDTRGGFGDFYLPIEFVQSLADVGLEFVLPEEKTDDTGGA